MINTACFPILYNAAFYSDVVKRKDENLCKFAYHNGFVVGEICARIEPLPVARGEEDGGNTRKRIYIMTLGVFAAYRGRGIGRKLVQSILDYYEGSKNDNEVDEISLHVQTSNADAMKFYIEGFGFEKGELIENYYKRIDPPHCFMLRKKLR